MEKKKVYKCAYCGAEYDTPAARGRCEMECDMKHQQELEREKRERLKKEKDERWNEVVEAREKYQELYGKYVDDYPREARGVPTSLWKLLWDM